MLLRRFYIQENEKGKSKENSCDFVILTTLRLVAPNPRSKKNREVNTGFDEAV